MLPKGLFWIGLGFVTVTVIVALAIFITEDEETWCDESLNAGNCEIYVLDEDETCFCIEEGSAKREDQQLGLFENAQAICERLNGTLATPEQRELLIWLSKRMFLMGVDIAFIGLKKIDSQWHWLKPSDEKVPAQNLVWRPDFPEIPGQTHGMTTVETVKKETNQYDYLWYNYDHYADNDKTYQWFGITTSDNTDDRLRGVYHICKYDSKPQVVEAEDTSTAPTAQIITDPCQCIPNVEVTLEHDQSETYSSPKYPANYCSDTSCRWTVRTSENLVVKLEWIVFHLEKNMDFVSIFDGQDDGVDSERLDACTGSRCRRQVSSDNVMHVYFTSDHVTTDLGFKFRVTAIDPDPCYCSALSTIELANPGESYTLQSPNYPEPYCTGISHNCSWTVVASQGYGLEIMWKDTESPRRSDAVYVYDSSSVGLEELTICSQGPCENVVTTGEALHINFLSDDKSLSNDDGRFSAVITVVQNYCEKSNLETADMLGTVAYSLTREDDKITVGSTATLTCAHSTRIENTLDTTQDEVTCIAPHWSSKLKICKEACIVNMSLLTQEVPYSKMGVCKFNMDQFYSGLVAYGDSIEVTQKDVVNDLELAPPVIHTCNGTQWTNGEPTCHMSGILLIGGATDEYIVYDDDYSKLVKTIDLYLPAQNRLVPVQLSLMTWRYEHGSALLGNNDKAIVVGGRNKKSPTGLRSTEIIDFKSMQVSHGPNLLEGRVGMAVAKLNESATVVCGGQSKSDFEHVDMLSSCEIYNLDSKKFSPFVEMSIPRRYFGLVLLNGCLYAVGGQTIERGTRTGSEVVFCSQKPVDQTERSMIQSRYGHATAVLDNSVVACGGLTNDHKVSKVSINECELYRLQEDQWQPMAGAMNEGRQHFIMAVYAGKLFVFGGARQPLVEIFTEKYDAESQEWILLVENFSPFFTSVSRFSSSVYASAVVIG